MKVLMINGSPHAQGNTAIALAEMEQVFLEEGFEVETIRVGSMDVRGCVSCKKCHELGRCVFDDVVNEIAPKLKEADGLVLGSPVYFASANSTLTALLDRLFYSSHFSKSMKVGCAIATARRGGITATFDQLNKYFTISHMPIASGQYWNGVHGHTPGEAVGDPEGLQQMRTVAQNMAFLMKSIALGKEAYGLPKHEKGLRTNFVH